MRKQHFYRLILVIILAIGVIFSYNSFFSEKETYTEIILETLNREIEGMALIISKTTTLDAESLESYDVATGSEKNNFKNDSIEGIKLKAARELFQVISKSEAYTEKMLLENHEYYMIQINFDFKGGTESTDIHEIYLFINSDTNQIVIPEYYIKPNELNKFSSNYYIYESNEIIRTLINLLLQ